MGKKKIKKNRKNVDLPTRSRTSYEEEIEEKLKIISALEAREDSLNLEIDDLTATLEQESESHIDIKDFVEGKVIIKEDQVDAMIDIEEVTH